MYKVKQSDLTGSIRRFPIEVVQKMVEHQIEQRGKADVSVFQISHNYGFEWAKTIEGPTFWGKVTHGNFDVFFERYPNKNVYYRGVEGRGNEIIKALERLGGKNIGYYSGNFQASLYYIKESGNIKSCADDSLIADVLKRGFTELFLPEIETIEIDGKKFRKDEVIETIKEKGLKEIK